MENFSTLGHIMVLSSVICTMFASCFDSCHHEAMVSSLHPCSNSYSFWSHSCIWGWMAW